ncbi:Uncharacterised protein [Burkholderia pseudomallei]|uniref:hypothetical protein n=1 Tax=Burkholderia pseudomallei TaxID=28450 RepID=UPI0005DC2DA4|nr:hypothetical protein [Burkholderia pseudomallei]AYX08846.1 hypothetical protein EGY14_36195 [Burkholderia pseudomallei]MBF4021936.1 hypothetical protein [Burkholderia pseudomallei]MBF4041360.1 hypothetical protein [Burkholderia pseudomallei]MBF4046801.1 hypothetical protein [Burkholderia pseudomallei]OMR41170.1 hypothetical protein AQ725_18765 [Burkholderia pseudomallei]
MDVDWNTIFTDATDAAITAMGNNAGGVAAYLGQVIQGHKQRLQLIGGFYASGSISADDLREKLDQEENTYNLQLQALDCTAEAALQIGINAFVNNLYTALLSTVKLV